MEMKQVPFPKFHAILQISCNTNCSQPNAYPVVDSSLPLCGVWLRHDNLHNLSGSYLAGESSILLKCAVSSLPRKAAVTWLYRPLDSEHAQVLFCSSLHTNSQVKFVNKAVQMLPVSLQRPP